LLVLHYPKADRDPTIKESAAPFVAAGSAMRERWNDFALDAVVSAGEMTGEADRRSTDERE
jgi:hypothetical protein